jgi:hypothetical protein
VKSFAKHVVIIASWKIAVYASRLELLATAERAVQKACSDEYTAPSLLFAYRAIWVVMGVPGKGSLSVAIMEPDLRMDVWLDICSMVNKI